MIIRQNPVKKYARKIVLKTVPPMYFFWQGHLHNDSTVLISKNSPFFLPVRQDASIQTTRPSGL